MIVSLLFNVVTFIFDIITCPIYAFCDKIQDEPQPEVIRVGNDWKRRDPPPPTIADDCETIAQLFNKFVKEFGDQKMLGTRPIHSKDSSIMFQGKLVTVKEMGHEYMFSSFNEVKKEASDLMKGFQSIGIKSRDRVMIFMDTRREWAMSTYALFGMNATVCTIYATLGDQGVISGINQTEVTHLITSDELLSKLKKLVPQMNDTLKNIIVVTDMVAGQYEDVSIDSMDGITIHRFDQVLDAGQRDTQEYEQPECKPNDIAVIMFTSGSTGDPKGVVISQENFVNGVKNLICNNKTIPIKPGDSGISYLPMAHSLEFMAHYCMHSVGIIVQYGTPYTLVQGAPGLKPGCPSDLQIVKPICLMTIPLMIERIRKEIEAKGNEKMGKLFGKFIEYKKKYNARGVGTPLIDNILLSKARNILGGNVQFMACGGAALSPETQTFIRDALSISFSMGWGATETCISGTFMEPHGRYIGRVGIPGDGVTLRLQDWEEGGYTVKDQPNPRGEVLVGSKSVAVGYFKNPELTDESFITDGDGNRWWVSGDIVEVFPDGSFKIIDRKKDLVKLPFGEYISLGKIEAQLKGCPIVDNICVIANSFHSFTAAIIVPNPNEMKLIAQSIGKGGEGSLSLDEMCKDGQILEQVLDKIRKTAQSSGLIGAEIPKKIFLSSDPWTPSNMLTSTFKPKRRDIQKHYLPQIEEMMP